MEIDSSVGQTCIAKQSLFLGVFVSLGCYLLGYHWLMLGLLFGLTLMIFNWRVLSMQLRVVFDSSREPKEKLVSFLSYYIRFGCLVLVMFLIIPKTNLYFGIGTFFGSLIPNLFLAKLLWDNRSDEWWLKVVPEEKHLPKPEPISYIEKELLGKNPFEVDLLEIEIKRYFNKQKEESKCLDMV